MMAFYILKNKRETEKEALSEAKRRAKPTRMRR